MRSAMRESRPEVLVQVPAWNLAPHAYPGGTAGQVGDSFS